MAQLKKGRLHPEVIQSLSGEIGVIKGPLMWDSVSKCFPKAKIIEYPRWEDVTPSRGQR